MLKIYGRVTSFNVQKVLWLADELALDYDHIQLGGRFGGLATPDFAKLNPLKKVPVLVDGDRSIWESHTILRYLAARYGDADWNPDDPYLRSVSDRWLDWSQTALQPPFMGVFWEYYRKPPQKREMPLVEQHLSKCFDCLQILERQLAFHPFLVSDRLTLADIPTGAVLFRLTEMGLDIPLPDRVSEWYQKLKARNGYRRWVMSDFSELKARETF